MSLHTDTARIAQRSYDAMLPPERDEEGFEFALDHVAAEVEAQAETAEILQKLVNAQPLVDWLMRQSIPQHLLHDARELSALVDQVSDRVVAEMKSYDDPRAA